MIKISNYYTMRFLKCIHIFAMLLWCSGAASIILLDGASTLSAEIETLFSTYFVRPGVFGLVATGLVYTLFTNFTCKQRWIRAKWIITFATALSGIVILSTPLENMIKTLLMLTLVVISVYHIPKNKSVNRTSKN